jgi:cob(I)alamin adenosyltransferase
MKDELNAVIGIAREHCALTENGLEEMLKEIQSRLFDLGAAVATPVQTSSSRKKAYTEVRIHSHHSTITQGAEFRKSQHIDLYTETHTQNPFLVPIANLSFTTYSFLLYTLLFWKSGLTK